MAEGDHGTQARSTLTGQVAGVTREPSNVPATPLLEDVLRRRFLEQLERSTPSRLLDEGT